MRPMRLDAQHPRSGARARLATLLSLTLLALVSTGGLAATAQAATYTVGTTEDLMGTCENPESGACSLRQLITYENSLTETPNPPDTIDVPALEGVAIYGLSNGALTIFKSVSIVGAGARAVNIDQFSQTPNRVFLVEPNPRNQVVPTVTISGVSMAFGHANESNGFFGGDILNEATLTLNGDAITNGTATEGSGGGISNDGGKLTITHSLVANNFSTNLPNGAGGDSGGIQNVGPNPVTEEPGRLTIRNSTIAENSAALGGGIYSWGDTSNTTSIVNSTIAFNDGGTRSTEGGGLLSSEGAISVENSIVALNTVEEPLSAERVPSNCGNSGISSLGYNLESAADCGFTATGDLQNTDPQFTSSGLQDNGGNTDTFALQGISPAVDVIPAGAPECAVTDQRNIARPQGAGCDIGAYELFQPVEGQQFSEVVGAAAPREGTTPEIDWGDGTQPSPGSAAANTGQLTGTHTYGEEGVYHASFTYINSDGFPETRPFDVKVQDAPLSAAPVPVAATAGVSFTGVLATFTDADPAGTTSDYTATIGWGDGANSAGTIEPVPGGGFAVIGSHTYAGVGAYQTSIKIADAGGATATTTGSANVVAAPPPPSPAPPTLLTTSPPTVLSTTSAAFTTTVNPHGLPTSVHFEYGPVLGGAKAAAITYGSVTPDQPAGSDFANHTVATTVTGLLPNVLYHVRAVAANSAGSTLGADQVLTTPADPPPPPPVLGKSVNVEPVSGIVYIELPPGAKLASLTPFALEAPAFAALAKGRSFIPLTEARQIPVGSILEATAGVARITTATTASRHGKLQFGDFGAGIFKLLQARRQRGLTDLNIIDNHSARQVCATRGKAHIAASHPSSKVLGRLSANSHGKFTAHGQYSAATVRGTIWSVANRCDGTLTRVKRGVLSVRDFHRRKTFTLFTGQSYLARAPHP
jgi:hypothetical protein